jgi:hypothetical protein
MEMGGGRTQTANCLCDRNAAPKFHADEKRAYSNKGRRQEEAGDRCYPEAGEQQMNRIGKRGVRMSGKRWGVHLKPNNIMALPTGVEPVFSD